MGNYYETFKPPFFMTKWSHFNPLAINHSSYERSDDAIVEDLLRRFRQLSAAQLGVNFQNIKVESLHQHVVLSGEVNSMSSKNFASKIADQIFGVREVANHLEVTRAGATANESMNSTKGRDRLPDASDQVIAEKIGEITTEI